MLYILLARKPILTFNTNSYHFCKLSLAKPSCLDQTGHVPNKHMDSSAMALEESRHPYHPEGGNALTVEALSGNTKEIVQRCPTESSIQVKGLYLFAYCSMLSLYTHTYYMSFSPLRTSLTVLWELAGWSPTGDGKIRMVGPQISTLGSIWSDPFIRGPEV